MKTCPEDPLYSELAERMKELKGILQTQIHCAKKKMDE
jgi:hypothetical protein